MIPVLAAGEFWNGFSTEYAMVMGCDLRQPTDYMKTFSTLVVSFIRIQPFRSLLSRTFFRIFSLFLYIFIYFVDVAHILFSPSIDDLRTVPRNLHLVPRWPRATRADGLRMHRFQRFLMLP